MDLLTTVRKEGSRGGRGDFKWSDVQSSTHRENYLGHSLMAPVGRWQKGKDLNWYAKADEDTEEGETAAEKAARERKEEIKRVKEAEQDALARALGYDVPPRNPNLEQLGDKKEVDRVLKESAEDGDAHGGKGVGFGHFAGDGPREALGEDERIEGTAEKQDAELSSALREYRRRHGEEKDGGRNRSKERDRKYHHRHGRDREHKHRHRSISRSRSREGKRRRGNRSRSRSLDIRRREDKESENHHGRGVRDRDRDRSRSPYKRRRRDNRENRPRRDDYEKHR